MGRQRKRIKRSRGFSTIQGAYRRDAITDKDVARAVYLKKITVLEYEEITGKPYGER